MKPTLESDERKAAINVYVDLLGNYGPLGSEGNSFNEILALYNEGKCGMWIDATIAASFLDVDGVAYAQSPNAGNPVGANWLWAWAMAVPTGSPNSAEAHKFIEWATSKEYIQAVGNHADFGWGKVPTGTRASTYANPEFPEVGTEGAQEIAAALSGAKSFDEALAASHAAADAIMKEAGYYSPLSPRNEYWARSSSSGLISPQICRLVWFEFRSLRCRSPNTPPLTTH